MKLNPNISLSPKECRKKLYSLQYILYLPVILSIALASCDSFSYQNKNAYHSRQNKIWVYVEVEKTMLKDTTNHFLYGQINESVLQKIDNNPAADGLFILSDIRYWNDDNLLQIYEDEKDKDFKVFRIQDIQYITSFQKDPVLQFEVNELHETALKLRNTNQQIKE